MGLMEADRLVPSKSTQRDSTHGAGWYLTDVGPSACERTLMRYCWPPAGPAERVRHYLEVEVEPPNVLEVADHVYFVPATGLAHFELISQGEVLECTLKPCEACPLNRKRT